MKIWKKAKKLSALNKPFNISKLSFQTHLMLIHALSYNKTKTDSISGCLLSSWRIKIISWNLNSKIMINACYPASTVS